MISSNYLLFDIKLEDLVSVREVNRQDSINNCANGYYVLMFISVRSKPKQEPILSPASNVLNFDTDSGKMTQTKRIQMSPCL